MDDVPLRETAVGVCAFHVADCIGVHVDKEYEQVDMFDKLLRLLRVEFHMGTGRLILKAVAEKNEHFARGHEQRAQDYDEKAANRDATGRTSAARSFRELADKERAEAAALRRAGWCKWAVPLAPRVSTTRKVVYQTGARKRFFQIFGLLAWGLCVRQFEHLQNAHLDAVDQGRQPQLKTGMHTRRMRMLRAIGRSIGADGERSEEVWHLDDQQGGVGRPEDVSDERLARDVFAPGI